jgi:hypothetical protein
MASLENWDGVLKRLMANQFSPHIQVSPKQTVSKICMLRDMLKRKILAWLYLAKWPDIDGGILNLAVDIEKL